MKKTDLKSKIFKEAATDYLFLLEKGYPQHLVLKLTGDRYKLSSIERSVLYRGISARDESASRRKKLVDPVSVKIDHIHIDGYNLLLTLGSYLNGNLVFLSTDGLLRDASEIHGKAFRPQLLDKAILLMFSYFESIKPKRLDFYFDEPISHSGEHCVKINALLEHYHIEGKAVTYRSPDRELRRLETGFLATSDSGIINYCPVPILDLGNHILTFHFNKQFLDLAQLLEVYC